ncbi:MAG: adenosine deaminase [Legionellales bacterium RIFCSPHIGHO2_12_FULL_37_14]|nr:MAG: adenosine deaminase [Legionellales bacterium RIFCSPHIGHO2_12_FULL_37_14]
MTILKAELHTHLEGTLSPTTALTLAKRNKVNLPMERISKNQEGYVFSDFLDFIHTYDTVVSAVIKSPLDYYDVTFDYLKRNAQEGAIYIEMMYSPELAEANTHIPSIEHLKAIQDAINDAEHQFKIVGRILITAIRHFGEEAARKVAQKALQETLPCVVGFGLAGDEINYPPEWFTKAFEIANEGGLACTIHAGEFGTAESMQTAMQTLPIKRIGHGVQAIHNRETIAMLKDKDITLEICPSSNVVLGLYPRLNLHPLPKLMEKGIKTCINSDDPPFFKSELFQEYQSVQDTFKFTDEVMLSFTRQAIEAAFVDKATKAKLLDKLETLIVV